MNIDLRIALKCTACVLCIAALSGCACGPTCHPHDPIPRLRSAVHNKMSSIAAACQSDYEPVVAPHPKFHPVPTRPVFAPLEQLEVITPEKRAEVSPITTAKIESPAYGPQWTARK